MYSFPMKIYAIEDPLKKYSVYQFNPEFVND
jgi:hypothetical protein